MTLWKVLYKINFHLMTYLVAFDHQSLISSSFKPSDSYCCSNNMSCLNHSGALLNNKQLHWSKTLSFGRRLMVLRGLSTRRTLRDLMVLMSLPLVPLWKMNTFRSHTELPIKPCSSSNNFPSYCYSYSPLENRFSELTFFFLIWAEQMVFNQWPPT